MADQDRRAEAAEIIQRHLSGDRKAFGELVALYGPDVRKRCRVIIRGRADVDDAVQEVWVSVARHVASFRNEAAFTTWLHSITTACALMALRNVWRNAGELCADEPCNGAQPDELADQRRTLSRLRAAMRTLSPSEKGALILGAIEGHTEAKVPKVHVANARAKLRRVV